MVMSMILVNANVRSNVGIEEMFEEAHAREEPQMSALELRDQLMRPAAWGILPDEVINDMFYMSDGAFFFIGGGGGEAASGLRRRSLAHLVREQIRWRGGRSYKRQDDVAFTGHAIESRAFNGVEPDSFRRRRKVSSFHASGDEAFQV